MNSKWNSRKLFIFVIASVLVFVISFLMDVPWEKAELAINVIFAISAVVAGAYGLEDTAKALRSVPNEVKEVKKLLDEAATE